MRYEVGRLPTKYPKTTKDKPLIMNPQQSIFLAFRGGFLVNLHKAAIENQPVILIDRAVRELYHYL
jgi:hypothetical protein